MSTIHPTKLALIRTTMALLEEFGESGFTVEDVLHKSNISKGSMYHHFRDFDDLIDHAHTMRFSDYVDEDIAAFADVVAGCRTRDEFLSRITLLAREIHSENRRGRRAERVISLARAAKSKSMDTQLGIVQARMTDAFADLFRELQERGILERNFSPKMFATFIQAYSLGKVVDDINPDPLDPEEWTNFVMHVIASWSPIEENA